MKKLWFLLIIVACIFITGCNKQGYVEISYSELQDKVDKQENIVLFVGRTSCTACSTYKEVLNEHAKDHKGIIIYYIDLDKLTEEESIKFDTIYDYSVTPTTFVLIKGKVENSNDKVTGYKSYSDLMNLLKKKGIM